MTVAKRGLLRWLLPNLVNWKSAHKHLNKMLSFVFVSLIASFFVIYFCFVLFAFDSLFVCLLVRSFVCSVLLTRMSSVSQIPDLEVLSLTIGPSL